LSGVARDLSCVRLRVPKKNKKKKETALWTEVTRGARKGEPGTRKNGSDELPKPSGKLGGACETNPDEEGGEKAKATEENKWVKNVETESKPKNRNR